MSHYTSSSLTYLPIKETVSRPLLTSLFLDEMFFKTSMAITAIATTRKNENETG